MGGTANTLRNRIDSYVAGIADDLIATRRALHANPELGFKEFGTAALIKSELESVGLAYRDGFGETGLATKIGAEGGKTVAIRVDMDALPITEQSTAEYASDNDGIMHACGHDAHTAIGIGVAKTLRFLGDDLPGQAAVLFQPAEELLGGAKAMIADGILDWAAPDAMLGCHNWPPLNAGQIGWHPKVAFSSADNFTVRVIGKSGHAAHPHLTADPIVATAQFIGDCQTIISREIAPIEAAVLSFGAVNGGTASNQIPEIVTLSGTFRCQSGQVRRTLTSSLKRKAEHLAAVHRCRFELEIDDGPPEVVNDEGVLASVLNSCRDQLGPDCLVQLPQGSMGSEDFAEFSTRIPSAHLRIGSRLAGHETMLHRDNFDIDEACIPFGVRALTAAAIGLM